MIGRRAAIALAATALAALAALPAGCGGQDSASSSVAQQPTSGPTPAPATTAPPAARPTATATTPAAPATPPATTTTPPTATTGLPPAGGESQPGGAGDEQGAQVPAAFTADGAALTPRRITVPAFLPVALAITARGAAHRVTVEAPGAGALDVAAGGTTRRRLAGLRPGDYRVLSDTGATAILHVVAGGAAGP